VRVATVFSAESATRGATLPLTEPAFHPQFGNHQVARPAACVMVVLTSNRTPAIVLLPFNRSPMYPADPTATLDLMILRTLEQKAEMGNRARTVAMMQRMLEERL
jgi:hypothetical protein